MNRITRRLPRVVPLILVLVVAAGCSGAAAPTQAPLVPPLASTNPSPPGDDLTPVPGGSAGGPLSDADRAAASVLATDPLFTNLEPYNADMIGQCCFYTVKQTADGWLVTVEIGWGDCPAGCIDKHRWTFTVDQAGAVAKTGETGPSVPPGEPGGG